MNLIKFNKALKLANKIPPGAKTQASRLLEHMQQGKKIDRLSALVELKNHLNENYSYNSETGELIRNKKTACKKCNRSKHNKTVSECRAK